MDFELFLMIFKFCSLASGRGFFRYASSKWCQNRSQNDFEMTSNTMSGIDVEVDGGLSSDFWDLGRL